MHLTGAIGPEHLDDFAARFYLRSESLLEVTREGSRIVEDRVTPGLIVEIPADVWTTRLRDEASRYFSRGHRATASAALSARSSVAIWEAVQRASPRRGSRVHVDVEPRGNGSFAARVISEEPLERSRS
jgi:hypothetical protein